MIGALGGFVLPIWVGVLNDFTNLWTSCFMLLFGLVCVALVWMHVDILIMDRRTIPATRGPQDLPELQDVGRPEGRTPGRHADPAGPPPRDREKIPEREIN